jgi:MFS family permease
VPLKILLKNRNLRWIFLGQLASSFGSMMTLVVLPAQVFEKTGSSLKVGLVFLIQLVPLVACGLIGGAIADTLNRKRLLLVSEILLTLLTLGLYANALQTDPNLSLIYIIAFVTQAVAGFHRPALEALTQQFASPEEIPALSVLSAFRFNFSAIVGPAVGGLIAARWSPALCYLIDALTFFLAFLSLLRVQYFVNSITEIKESWKNQTVRIFKEMRAGFQFASSQKAVLASYLVDFFAMLFAFPLALFPAVAKDFNRPELSGTFLSLFALGGMFSTIFSGWTKTFYRRGWGIVVSAFLWGLAIVGFGLAKDPITACSFLAIAGFFDSYSAIFRGTLWNEVIPNDKRGRLAGIEMISYMSGPQLGGMRAGTMAEYYGNRFSITSGGLLCALSMWVVCRIFPEILTSLPKNSRN